MVGEAQSALESIQLLTEDDQCMCSTNRLASCFTYMAVTANMRSPVVAPVEVVSCCT